MVGSGQVNSLEEAEKKGFKRGTPAFGGFEAVFADKRRQAAEDVRKQQATLLTGLGTTKQGNPRLG